MKQQLKESNNSSSAGYRVKHFDKRNCHGDMEVLLSLLLPEREKINQVEITDEQLMTAASGGDIDAYNQLYRKYRKPLYNFIFRYIGDRETAGDIFQETFVRVFQARKRYKPTAKFSVYLFTIAHRLCINFARNRERRGLIAFLSDKIFGGSKADSPTLKETVASKDLTPAKEVCNKELGDVLKEALDNLPQIHRTAFILFETNNFTYKEIAEITQTNVGTVKSRLNHARKKLRKLLKNYVEK